MERLSAKCFDMLSRLSGFKIYREKGDLIIEAEGATFNASCLCAEEALMESYIFIKAREQAKEMIKNTKISI